MKHPWMPLYVMDYQLDTTDLSAEQHGVYLLLLMFAWRQPDGRLPNDKKWLRSILPHMHGLTYNRLVPPILERFFVLQDGRWNQKRLEKERRKSEEISEKQTRNINKRWADYRKNKELADTNVLPSQSQSQSQEERKSNSTAKYAFEAGLIRLTQKDYDQWKKIYPRLNLDAELLQLSRYAEKQGSNWFFAVSGALTKRDRELGIQEREKLNGHDRREYRDGRI